MPDKPEPRPDDAAGDRDAHLAWCKARALAYLDRGELGLAFASMSADLTTHAATSGVALAVCEPGLEAAIKGSAAAMRLWIEGLA